jgi:hypothetical protein
MDNQGGWFAVHRTPQLEHMAGRDHSALVLMMVIAMRAKWDDSWSKHGLKKGQALIGAHDVKRYGLTDQKYRSAKKHLEEYGIATFQSTHLHTVATLTGSTVSIEERKQDNRPDSRLPTDCQQTANRLPTTNIHSYTNTPIQDTQAESPLPIFEGKPIEESKPAKPKKKRDESFDPVAYLDESAKEGAYNNLAESEAFKAAWADFVQHRKEKKSPLAKTATRMQLKKLAAWGSYRAIQAIERSIAGGWTNIYEAEGDRSNGSRPIPSNPDHIIGTL